MIKDEALRLADQIHAGNGKWMQEAAYELRRLHGENKYLKASLANEALERKAENARELGLDYEPDEPKESVRLQCITCGTIYAEGVPPQVHQSSTLEAKDEPAPFNDPAEYDDYDAAVRRNEGEV
jgi:hypothetical protein